MIKRWLIGALSIYIVSFFMEGISITGFKGALFASIVLGIVNVTIKPIISLFALPITIITFGLFTFIINGIVLLIASYFLLLAGGRVGTAIIGALFLNV